MKMSAENVAKLRAAIEPLDTEKVRDRMRSSDFDHVRSRDRYYRWALLRAAGGHSLGVLDGLGDAHIDTALRAIVRPL